MNPRSARASNPSCRFLIAALLLGLVPGSICAQSAPNAGRKHVNLENGLAIQGYDPVAYFTGNRALRGAENHAYRYQNATYYFASQQNLEAFKKNPARYEPAYGGWCAYAMGDSGEKVSIDPETFKVKDGQLLLFYHSTFNNTLPKWNKNEAKLHQQADQHWRNFVNVN
ncbi:MAG: YHS domain-containing protein [Ferruginibacter sp.]|nr:YHS domain-containing protein [Cytophagales bacterium]